MATVQEVIEYVYAKSKHYIKRMLAKVCRFGLKPSQEVKPAVAITLAVHIPKLNKHLQGLSHEEISGYFKRITLQQPRVESVDRTPARGDDGNSLERAADSSIDAGGDSNDVEETGNAMDVRYGDAGQDGRAPSHISKEDQDLIDNLPAFIRESFEKSRRLSEAQHRLVLEQGQLVRDTAAAAILGIGISTEAIRQNVFNAERRTEEDNKRLEQETIDVTPH